MSPNHLVARLLLAALGLAATPASALEVDFRTGALIIPTDTTYQDEGILEAYGLVHAILGQGVSVNWCIRPGKLHGELDFVASGEDWTSGAPITGHAYRGGPFVISDECADSLTSLIDAWLLDHPTVVVHRVTAPFTANVSRILSSPATMAVAVDGWETFPFDYLNAAGIPDSFGQPWPTAADGSGIYAGWPDVLDATDIIGPDPVDHEDGALFLGPAEPAYCHLSAGMDLLDAGMDTDDILGEYDRFTRYRTGLFAGYRAPIVIENSTAFGHYLSTAGIEKGGDANKPFDYYQSDGPVAQADGDAEGREAEHGSYSLEASSSYHDDVAVRVSVQGEPIGDSDWLISNEAEADPDRGTVTYLGGKGYSVRLPISDNPRTNAIVYFLNSIFEANCVSGVPPGAILQVIVSAPPTSVFPNLDIQLDYASTGSSPGSDVALKLPLPPGTSFDSACCGGSLVGSEIVWDLGTVLVGARGTVSARLTVAVPGTTVTVQASIQHGPTCATLRTTSNQTQTLVDLDTDGDEIVDPRDNCVVTPNPSQVDSDADGAGDACDNCLLVANESQANADSDALGDSCDNCPAASNPGQENADGDLAGDACDPCSLDPLDDADGDGHCADVDNCPLAANPNQADADADGPGDACDPCPLDALDDAEGDGHCADVDNCPIAANPDQADADADGAGDACDPCPLDALDDAEGDGHCADVDNCPLAANPNQADADADGAGDACDPCPLDALDDAEGDGHCADVDNCPLAANPNQADADADGAGDACDPCPLDALDDAEGDGHCADVDNCPLAANPNQADADADGAGDACDPCPLDALDDAEGDGYCADVDNCPLAANPSQADADADEAGDACDPCPLDALDDDDDDGHCADLDNCALVANPNQADADADGAGDACDPCPLDELDDADDDGHCANVDNCPAASNPGQEDDDANGVGNVCECGVTYTGPPVQSVAGLRPLPGKVLVWDALADADAYLVYRGTIPAGGTFVTRPQPYDHACNARVTTPRFVEADSPPLGPLRYGAFYYLILAANPCGESAAGLGHSAFGVPRPVPSCP